MLKLTDKFILEQIEASSKNGEVYVSTVKALFKARREEIQKRVDKDKKKMGADLAFYMDIRNIVDVE